MTKISVVVPAYNEAERLPTTLEALRGVAAVDEIVVVDDGSTDETGIVARGAKTRILRRHRNGGKGAALEHGVAAVDGEIVLLLDADLGESAVHASVLIDPLRKGAADIVIASFRSQTPAGFGLVQRFARAGIRRLCGLTMASPLSGQRAVHRRVFGTIAGFAPGFGAEVAFTIDAARAGFRIIEVPVAFSHDETGRDLGGFIHRGTQLWHVGKALLPRALGAGRSPSLPKPPGADNP